MGPESRRRSTTLREGDPAPAFSLPAAGGGEVALADFAGRPVVLIFFRGTW